MPLLCSFSLVRNIYESNSLEVQIEIGFSANLPGETLFMTRCDVMLVGAKTEREREIGL